MLIVLTDGMEIFEYRNVDYNTYRQLSEEALKSTDGNVWWAVVDTDKYYIVDSLSDGYVVVKAVNEYHAKVKAASRISISDASVVETTKHIYDQNLFSIRE